MEEKTCLIFNYTTVRYFKLKLWWEGSFSRKNQKITPVGTEDLPNMKKLIYNCKWVANFMIQFNYNFKKNQNKTCCRITEQKLKSTQFVVNKISFSFRTSSALSFNWWSSEREGYIVYKKLLILLFCSIIISRITTVSNPNPSKIMNDKQIIRRGFSHYD